MKYGNDISNIGYAIMKYSKGISSVFISIYKNKNAINVNVMKFVEFAKINTNSLFDIFFLRIKIS